MKQRIAIIGANEQQNPLILKARDMGFETHVFAWQTGEEVGEQTADFFYPISAGNKEAILARCRALQVCAVVSIGSDMAALSAAYVCENMGLRSNTYAAVVCAANKLLTRSIFEKCGIPQPNFAEIGDSIPQRLHSLKYPLIVKPSDRSGGRGLTMVRSPQQLMRAISHAREASFERKAIAEEFVNGQLCSCECVSFDGHHHVLGFTRRSTITVGGRICENTHFQPANLPCSAEAQMEKLSTQALSALGLRWGASSIEFILGEDGQINLIEVTPAMYGDFIGTHLIPLSYGYDYLKMVIEIACGLEPEFRQATAVQMATVRFLYEQADRERALCDGAKQAASWPEYLPDIPDGSRYGYCISTRPFQSFGGCAPMELAQGTGWFDDVPAAQRLGLNSEYAAFWYALRHMGAKSVHMPYYTSPVWSRVAEDAGVQVKYYHIGLDFQPVDLHPAQEDAVLIVNYHGLCHDFIRRFSAGHSNVIIDNSMAFFAEPVVAQGVYNIYACRKFFAVPDGAWLISRSLPGRVIALETDVSYRRAGAMLKALELGEAAAYKEHQAIEQALGESRMLMSRLTERMLEAVDYPCHARRRRENFDLLHTRLEKFQLLPLNTGSEVVPQFYPLLVDGDIRRSLVSKNIFIPLMWRKLLGQQFDGTAEQMLSRKLLCLPVDPRYSLQDMEYLAQTITALLS